MALDILNKYFDLAKDYVLRKTKDILSEKIVSPIPDDYVYTQAKRNKEKPKTETKPTSNTNLSNWGKDLSNWNYVYGLVLKNFGDEGHNMMEVLKGENRGLNPMAENVNKDGSVDRGLFQINSNTFADFMRRKGNILKKEGITDFKDMYDPEKNIKMAKIIWEEQGYNAWYGAPSYLRKK